MALQDFFSELVLIRVVSTKDALGSVVESYKTITTFFGGITVLRANKKEFADQEKAETVYQLTTAKDIDIKFGDIIKFSNSHYRVISDENKTPKSARLNIQIFTMRKIKI